MIVLDASVTVAWLLNEPGAPAFALNIALAEHKVIVPAHWPVEIANALLTALRLHRITSTDITRLAKELVGLDIQIDLPMSADRLAETISFAQAHHLTTYDAAYVMLAIETGAGLATLDKAMRRTAIRLGIAYLPA